MGARVVKPEILDHLAADDPEAVRSRRDLRRINFLMGNERWVCRRIRGFPQAAMRGIVELGAGGGELAAKLARIFPEARVTACDLAPRPAALGERVVWRQGDVLSDTSPPSGGVLVANLFLHHFEGDSLLKIGRICDGFDVLVFNEPDRAALPHLLGASMWPLVNRVTRHDMHVSIDGGFAPGELPRLLGLDRKTWRIRETSTWRGARRVLGSRS
jgi:SAM-dependent methyltransferase